MDIMIKNELMGSLNKCNDQDGSKNLLIP